MKFFFKEMKRARSSPANLANLDKHILVKLISTIEARTHAEYEEPMKELEFLREMCKEKEIVYGTCHVCGVAGARSRFGDISYGKNYGEEGVEKCKRCGKMACYYRHCFEFARSPSSNVILYYVCSECINPDLDIEDPENEYSKSYVETMDE